MTLSRADKEAMVRPENALEQNVVHVGEQIIRFDEARTAKAYKQIDHAWADECNCTPCRNFSPQRRTAFSSRFFGLLQRLGIDALKESEVYGCYPMSSGLRQYGGWFFFCGELLQDGSGVLDEDGMSYYVRGPGNMPKPSDSFEPNPLALEFTIEIPWVLAGEDPDELYGSAKK